MKIKQLAVVQAGYSFRARLEASGDEGVSVIQMKDLLPDNTVYCAELVKVEIDRVK